MAYVVTADQIGSRRSRDAVPEALGLLSAVPALRPYERTAGDEVQGVLGSADDVVTSALALARDGRWSIGIGLGPVEEPLPDMTRAGRGAAFSHARDAVEAAKRRPQRVAVRGPDEKAAADAQAVLTLLVAVVQRRSDAAWHAADLVRAGMSMSDAATKLGVTRQAIGQRLAAGLWQQEQDARPAVARSLARAEASG